MIVQKNVLDRQRGVRGDKVLPVGQRYSEIIEKMQDMHQQRFVRRASYDGLKNLYSPMKLDGATKVRVYSYVLCLTARRCSILAEVVCPV